MELPRKQHVFYGGIRQRIKKLDLSICRVGVILRDSCDAVDKIVLLIESLTA